MDSELVVLHTLTLDGAPMATIENFPGMDADMTPAQMRSLANALMIAANDCELMPSSVKNFRCQMRSYSLTQGETNVAQ